MTLTEERAALVALLRQEGRSPQAYADLVEEAGSVIAVLERELASGDDDQTSLFAAAAQPALAEAEAEIEHWQATGYNLITILDEHYPQNLRAAHDRPALIFVAGHLQDRDRRAVAIIGSRRASPAGIDSAHEIASRIVSADYTVVSGLAAGIDAAAHTAALDVGGRTIAVLGTGLNNAYPRQNADLQRRIATSCAVVSQFWPDAPPSRQSFPQRNAVMSGLALGTVIVEASVTSGARIQARQALAHGRPVFLMRSLLGQPWASELATRPGVYTVDSPEQITSALERLHSRGALVA